jgi:hypothetical protein
VQVTLARGHGLYLRAGNMVSLYDCYFNANDGCGVKAEESQVVFSGCAFENNCQSPAMDATWGGQVYLRSCSLNRFDGCLWERFTTAKQPRNKQGLTIENSPGCTVSNSRFVNDREDPSPGQRGIYCTYGGTPGVMACVFLPNRFDHVKVAIEVDTTATGAARECIVYPQFVSSGTGRIIASARPSLGAVPSMLAWVSHRGCAIGSGLR